MAAAGQPAAYYKWIQTGTNSSADPDDDAGFVAHFSQGLAGDVSAGWRLKTPKAPLYAARDSAVTLDPDELLLALPLVPRHEICPDSVPLSAQSADFDASQAQRPSPFAALAALKGGKPAP